MILVSNMTTKMLLRGFSTTFVIILSFHGTISRGFDYPDMPQSLEGHNDIASYEDVGVDKYIPDDSYPYEEIERIVVETKQLLMSDDEEEKRKLNIDPSVYGIYEKPIHIRPRVGKKSRKKADRFHKSGCSVEIQETFHRRLTNRAGDDFYIVNVNSKTQKTITKKCRNTDETCEKEDRWPFGYQVKCEQMYADQLLLALPVDKELVLTNQELNKFSLPSGCDCVLKRIE